MYPENMVAPMRKELTDIGFSELKTSANVDAALKKGEGTILLLFNSVCGCAGGNARPGVKIALEHSYKPDYLTTVFAGQDTEAVQRARSYIAEYPPSSPSMAIFKDSKLVFMLERKQIEGYPPEDVAKSLTDAFDRFCS